jgi:hypothetical protein
MRATTGLITLLACGFLSITTLSSASSLPGVAQGASAQGLSKSLAEKVHSRRMRQMRRYGNRRPYYAPYFCSRPYQYRYWQFYAPICYPL